MNDRKHDDPGALTRHTGSHCRRGFLRRSLELTAVAGVVGATGVRPAQASIKPDATAASGNVERSLAFVHTHTGERIELVYAAGNEFDTVAMERLNHFLRDHYSGEVGRMDPQLFDLLHALRARVGAQLTGRGAFEVISAYRSPVTNANLRSSRSGGVAKNSLHMQGRAMDIRLPGVPLAALRLAALSLRAGGVGYYPRDGFVHVDTGAVRSWQG